MTVHQLKSMPTTTATAIKRIDHKFGFEVRCLTILIVFEAVVFGLLFV